MRALRDTFLQLFRTTGAAAALAQCSVSADAKHLSPLQQGFSSRIGGKANMAAVMARDPKPLAPWCNRPSTKNHLAEHVQWHQHDSGPPPCNELIGREVVLMVCWSSVYLASHNMALRCLCLFYDDTVCGFTRLKGTGRGSRITLDLALISQRRWMKLVCFPILSFN